MATSSNRRGSTAGGPRYDTVLLPVDFSAVAWRVLPIAQATAARFDVTVLPFHVDTSAPWLGLQDRDAIVPVAAFGQQLAVHVVTAEDPVAGVLAMVRRHPHGLIVMSTHGHRGLAEAAVGSVFDRVVRSGERTTLTVGPRFDPRQSARPRRIVACLDGSAVADAILPTALAWAHRCDAPLELVTVAEGGPTLPGRRQPTQRVDELAEELAAAGEPVTAVTLAGTHPGRELVAYASATPGTVLALATHARPTLTRCSPEASRDTFAGTHRLR